MQYFIHTASYDEWPIVDSTPLFAKDNRGEWESEPRAYLMGDCQIVDSDDLEITTRYRVFDELLDDISEANCWLRDTWADSLDAETREKFANDPIMHREAFNNWTDSLCKDGVICDDTYNECSLED